MKRNLKDQHHAEGRGHSGAAEAWNDYPHPLTCCLLDAKLEQLGGLEATDFNANHVIIPPGYWSSQRHWHQGEADLVVILERLGRSDRRNGPSPDGAGGVAVSQPAMAMDTHHHEDGDDLVLIAVGIPEASSVYYPDIDLIWTPEQGELHRDGTRYGADQRRSS